MALIPDNLKTQITDSEGNLKSVSAANAGGNLTSPKTNLPWNKSESTDVFFKPIEIDGKRVNNLYPYRLIVWDVAKNKIVEGGDSTAYFTKNDSNTGGVQYKIGAQSGWIFNLPITPQQLSITDQFAINTTATMRGVVEEHNGVKFKMISASGTTGIWPTRVLFEDPNTPGLSLFGGTLEAISGVASAFNKLANGGNSPPTTINPEKIPDEIERTGYYQALLLQQFLEQYAMAKKNPLNKNWRLIFDCPKTNESFVVTPVQYTVTRSQRSPGEFLYAMQFKAWKRIQLGKSVAITKKIIPLDVGFFQKTVNTLDNARGLMSASLNVIKAIRADYRQVFDQLRKISLLAKDLGAISYAVSDFNNVLVKDIQSSVQKMIADNKSIEWSVKDKKIVDSIKKLNKNNEGMSDNDVNAGGNGRGAQGGSEASGVGKVFSNPEAYFQFLSKIDFANLKLDIKQKNALQDELIKNSETSIEDLKKTVKDLRGLIIDLNNKFGAGDKYISYIYNLPSPQQRATPMTIEEFELVRSLEEVVLVLNIFTATRDFDDSKKQSPLEYVGGLANDSQISFDSTSTAKILAPVPYGLTIEQISARLLGDPDRYNEIITLNNLRSPYIDENGFFYSFLSNGDGRQFNINSTEHLFVGQKIQLSSNTVSSFSRKITKIERITDTNYLITVDGEDNLNTLIVTDNAKVKAFLPGTINSQNQIYIPSTIQVTDQSRTYDIPFLKSDTLTGISKIDWLLDESGDLIINSFGEVALANGTTNLIQALRMKVVTEKGTLLSNPTFGLALKPGLSVADADIENILKDLRDMVLQDSRFEAVENIEINVLPPDVSITINARLINGRGVFPINFSV